MPFLRQEQYSSATYILKLIKLEQLSMHRLSVSSKTTVTSLSISFKFKCFFHIYSTGYSSVRTNKVIFPVFLKKNLPQLQQT